MLKKIILSVLLIGLIGILVWGGVNRTLAKNNNGGDGRNANYENAELIEYVDGNGAQQRSNGNYGQGNYVQQETHDTGLVENLDEENTSFSQGKSNGNGQRSRSDPLTATEIEALRLALEDEYHALAIYQSVIATFGEVEPFVQIATSEQRHIEALSNQFNKNGLSIPENPWIGNIPIFGSVQQACLAGVEAEIANADLYNQLLSMTNNPSLIRVFTNLSGASLNNHLPDFENCQ